MTTGRHTVGGAPPPGVFLAQSQDNSKKIVSIKTNLRLGS
jgi:hypothetical protein